MQGIPKQATRPADLVALARASGATVVESRGAVVIVLAASSDDGAELLPIDRAAKLAATSARVVRDAIRAGELAAFGRQRDRSVRRADLAAWIEARRAPVVVGRDDDAIERRVRRLERGRR